MTTELFRHRLECLDWEAHSEKRQPNSRLAVWATSCGHTIIAYTDSHNDAWSAVCTMAMKLTREELLPRP